MDNIHDTASHVSKRPRLSGPDGFSKRKAVPTASTIAAPLFQSDFTGADSTTAKPTSANASNGKSRAVMPSRISRGSGAKPESAPATARKRLAVPPRPATDVSDRADPVPNIASSSKTRLPAPLRTAFPVAVPEKRAATLSFKTKPITSLPKFVPPSPTLPSTTPPKRRPPPPHTTLFHSPPTPPGSLKTISSTRFARTADPTSEGGAAEVLALFLQQHNLPNTSPADREIARGLDFTPQKAGHGRARRHTPGGLAEWAQHALSKTEMSLSLWHKALAAATSPTAPDTVFRVLQVRHAARPGHHNGGCLALCQSGGTEAGAAVLVLFSSAAGGDGECSAPRGGIVEVGKEVGVWKPIVRLDVPGELAGEGWPGSAVLCSRFSVMVN